MTHQSRQASADSRRQRRLLLELFGDVVFYQADHVAVGLGRIEGEHHETVQRVAVARGVDLGVDDGVAQARKKTAEAGEQQGLVLHVDHHLQAVTHGVEACAHDRFFAGRAMVEGARMPGYFLGGVAHEIAGIELAPEFEFDVGTQAVIAQDAARFFLSFRDAGEL